MQKWLKWVIGTVIVIVLIMIGLKVFSPGKKNSEEMIASDQVALEAEPEIPAEMRWAEEAERYENLPPNLRTGSRESLWLEYGQAHRNVGLKDLPAVTWDPVPEDPNIEFPLDEKGDIILGAGTKNAPKPPAVVTLPHGYKWVHVNNVDVAPAKWKGAVADTGKVYGKMPAVITTK